LSRAQNDCVSVDIISEDEYLVVKSLFLLLMASWFLNTTAVAILAKFTLFECFSKRGGEFPIQNKRRRRQIFKRVVCSLPSLGLDKGVLWIKPVSDG